MINKINYAKHIFYSLEDKIFISRTLSTLVLLFIYNFVFAIPLLNMAKDVGYDINVTVLPMYLYDFEYDCGFIAIMLYFFSGVPFLKSSEMYCIIREGKSYWAIKQIIHIVAMSFVFIVMAAVTSIMPFLIRGDINNQWGKIAYTLSLTDKNLEYDCVKFPSSILNKYTPWESLIVCALFVMVIVMFMGILMFTFSLVFNRVIGICMGACFEILMIVAYNLRIAIGVLVYVSPCSWLDITVLGKQKSDFDYSLGTPTMSQCLIELIMAMVIFSIVSVIRINRMSLNYTNED